MRISRAIQFPAPRLASACLLTLFLAAAFFPVGLRPEEPKGGWKSAESSLKNAILAKEFVVAQRLVTELAATDDVRGYKLILKYALGGHSYDLDRLGGRTLAAVESSNIRKEVFDAVSKGRNVKTKIILLAVLKRWRDDPRAMETLHGALRSSRKEVVFTALRWIRDLNSMELSMDPLIDELARRERRPRDRVYFDLQRTLENLSDQKFEVSADWRNYWKGRQGGKKPVVKPRSESRTVLYKRPSFFSVTVDTDRVLFIIDVSGSMKIPDTVIQKPRRPAEEPGVKGRTVVVKPDGTTGSEKPSGVKSKQVPRITRVKHELLKTLAGLPSHVRFGIMNFNHQIGFFGSAPPPLPQEDDKIIKHSATPGLVIASKANKEKAYQWVRGLKPSGATRTDLAVARGFEIPDIDTIYLLTDGAPRDIRNQKIAPELVLQVARICNRFRKARIHTIGFSQAGSTMQQLCRDLAGQNDGKCVLLE
ncbi:MAG: hypothetical protein VCD34_04710 [Planctomycetota bacterium]